MTHRKRNVRCIVKNHWKKGFWILFSIDLILLLALVGAGFSFLSVKPNPTPQNFTSPALQEPPVFTVDGNKNQLTALMNQELQKELSGNLESSISLDKQVVISGNIKVLGVLIPYKMLLQPKVENNGETVYLNESSVTVGSLSLPVAQVLVFIQKGASFPKWVVVEPYKKRIAVHLSGFVIRDQFTIRAEKIDLPNSKLVFNIYRTPTKQ